jgi:hypothetical protein
MKKITPSPLQVQKLLLLLLPTTVYNSWAKIQQLFLNKIKGNANHGSRKETTGYISPSVYGSQTCDGRCCIITILSIMTTIKNYFDWLLSSNDGLKTHQVSTLMQEGGAA